MIMQNAGSQQDAVGRVMLYGVVLCLVLLTGAQEVDFDTAQILGLMTSFPRFIRTSPFITKSQPERRESQ